MNGELIRNIKHLPQKLLKQMKEVGRQEAASSTVTGYGRLLRGEAWAMGSEALLLSGPDRTQRECGRLKKARDGGRPTLTADSRGGADKDIHEHAVLVKGESWALVL